MANSDNPRVSVCIPTYNYGRFLSFALDSIVAQTFKDWEVVVCDNCSTDDTEQIVQDYQSRLGSRVRYCRNQANIGSLGNFNRCYQHARGDYVIFLCADDALAPSALEEMVLALDRYPSAGIAAAYLNQTIDENGQDVGAVSQKRLGPGLVSGRDILYAQCRFSGIVGYPSQVLIRSASLGPGDVFDARFSHNFDNALWCSLCEKWDVAYAEKALAYIRNHGETVSAKSLKSSIDIRSRATMFQMLFRESPTLRGQRRLRYQFVRYRLYPWFDRALQAAQQGEWRKSLWILKSIASFSWIPWWLPYFAFIRIRRSFSTHFRSLW